MSGRVEEQKKRGDLSHVYVASGIEVKGRQRNDQQNEALALDTWETEIPGGRESYLRGFQLIRVL